MITIEKLKIYYKWGGDGDMWARSPTVKEKQSLQDADWELIDDLIQNITLLQNVKVSEEFKINLRSRLNANCDNEATELYLKKITMDLR